MCWRRLKECVFGFFFLVFQDNEIDDGWKDVTDALYEKGAKYLVTHDFEATVPGFLGGGPSAKVRLSPKKILPDGGIILRMDVLPPENDGRSSRSIHKTMSKWRVSIALIRNMAF